MSTYGRKNLNIKRLLGLKILDIRGMAERNANLTAHEYFNRVEQFIENAPKLGEVLTNISTLEANAKALKELESKLGVGERSVDFSKDTAVLAEVENLKSVLSGIGYNELDFDLEAISHGITNANLPLVEKLAVEAAGKFNFMYDQIKVTYSTKKFESVPAEAGASADSANSRMLLKEVLNSLDYEEANRKLRVLAVDDVPIVLNTITSVLSPYYEVFALKNSSQIGKFLMHTTPDLFLLDIEMSEINGFDLVPLIRRFEEHKNTPIIFLTGNASYNNLKDAIALGACDFITKPVNKDILLEKIDKNIVRNRAY